MKTEIDNGILTGYTREKLPCKVLNLSARERHETIALEEIKDTLS